jgi:hypothetical protein
LTVSPSTGTASAGSPGSSSVAINAIGLASGVYRGGVSYAYSGASVRTVNVTLIVPQAARRVAYPMPSVPRWPPGPVRPRGW